LLFAIADTIALIQAESSSGPRASAATVTQSPRPAMFSKTSALPFGISYVVCALGAIMLGRVKAALLAGSLFEANGNRAHGAASLDSAGTNTSAQEVHTMPVYEFTCRDCQKTFEIIRPMSESSSVNVTCVHCGSNKVERIWSTVYAVTSKKS
jgi:putative FmdB family regulatory protein